MKKYKKDMTTLQPLGWLLSKKQKIISISKNIEKLDCLQEYKMQLLWKMVWKFLTKIKK